MSAAILRAFPREKLVDRGTPLSLIVTADREEARIMAFALRKLLPDRDIGLSTPGSYTDSDDIVITSYSGMKDVPCWLVGILIACNIDEGDFTARAGAISAVRNAARWGLYTTAGGGCMVDEMALEGLFGNVVAQATYSDAVNAGYAAPITVCWLPSPYPVNGVGYGSFRMQEAQAIQNNPSFCDMVSEIIRRTPSELGCICCTEHKGAASKIAAHVKGVEFEVYSRRIGQKVQRIVRENITSGDTCRAIVSYDTPLAATPQSVLIVATCQGGDYAVKRLPWKVATCESDRAYIVDFRHHWDTHNGQPGYLARNDDARERRYKEFGFRQMYLSNMEQLPFIVG